MRLASTLKATGSGDLIWEGFTPSTIPNDLFLAIEHAIRVISWQENMTSDECPPVWMWHLDWEIEEWFKKVSIERDKKWGTNKESDEIPEGAMWEENVYFDQLKEELKGR